MKLIDPTTHKESLYHILKIRISNLVNYLGISI